MIWVWDWGSVHLKLVKHNRQLLNVPFFLANHNLYCVFEGMSHAVLSQDAQWGLKCQSILASALFSPDFNVLVNFCFQICHMSISLSIIHIIKSILTTKD